MRAAFVLTTLALALALGIIAAISGSGLLMGALVIGIVPAIVAVASVIERLMGRDLWHFTAPYPYRWMREQRDTALPRPNAAEKTVEDPPKTDERSPLRLTA